MASPQNRLFATRSSKQAFDKTDKELERRRASEFFAGISKDMQVNFNTSLGMPSSFYQLLLKLRKKYGYASSNIDGYTQTYAQNGVPQSNGTAGTAAATQTGEVDNTNQVADTALKEEIDYYQLIEDLKLYLPENKFAILLMLPYGELMQMLNFLEKGQLVNGLNFFTKEKLLTLVARLPKKDLLKMLFHMFTDKKQLIENLPTKEIMGFLSSDQIGKRHIMKVFELMPRQTLSKIAGYLTRKDCSKMSKKDLMQEIQPFKKFHIVDGLKRLDEKGLRGFVTTLCESFPKLYNEFSHGSLFDLTSKFARTDIVESMIVLDSDKLMEMVGQLPDKLIALTASQINPEIFAQILLADYKDLLAGLVLA